jgi:hypothetical protein
MNYSTQHESFNTAAHQHCRQLLQAAALGVTPCGKFMGMYKSRRTPMWQDLVLFGNQTTLPF